MTSHTDSIPDWAPNGVLPPNNPNDPTSPARSPYTVSLVEFIVRFGFSDHRRSLITGLLDFRAELHQAGLTHGFQWINGSFVERIETTSDRPPDDIDLVTFFHLPAGQTQESLWNASQELFNPRLVKMRHQTDAYFVPLNPAEPDDIVKQTIYWYSLWSHNRQGDWKGFLQIDLSDDDDRQARLILEQFNSAGGEP